VRFLSNFSIRYGERQENWLGVFIEPTWRPWRLGGENLFVADKVYFCHEGIGSGE